MLTKYDLQREVGSLELLISALSNDLVNEKNDETQAATANLLVREMEEALTQLRQARGMKKVLLLALADNATGEKSIRRAKRRLCH